MQPRTPAVAAVVAAAFAAFGGATDAGAQTPELTAPNQRAAESAGVAAVRFSLPRPARRTIRFRATPRAGTAGADDMVLAPVTGVFRRGRRRTTVNLPLHNDGLDEEPERFLVRVSRGAKLRPGPLRRLAVAVTIVDDDAPPALSLGDAPPVPEGTGAATQALQFPITLSGPSGRRIGVSIRSLVFGATSGGPVRVVILPGATSAIAALPVRADSRDEPDQAVPVQLFGPANATIADADGTGTILDDDEP
jgi:large repetitive protein